MWLCHTESRSRIIGSGHESEMRDTWNVEFGSPVSGWNRVLYFKLVTESIIIIFRKNFDHYVSESLALLTLFKQDYLSATVLWQDFNSVSCLVECLAKNHWTQLIRIISGVRPDLTVMNRIDCTSSEQFPFSYIRI